MSLAGLTLGVHSLALPMKKKKIQNKTKKKLYKIIDIFISDHRALLRILLVSKRIVLLLIFTRTARENPYRHPLQQDSSLFTLFVKIKI